MNFDDHNKEDYDAGNMAAPGSRDSKKYRQIHVAHRRSPSELTSLMIDQYNLQRQLEAVQAQQQQILRHQYDQGQYGYQEKGYDDAQTMNVPELDVPRSGMGWHSRTSSNVSSGGAGGSAHRRTGSASNSGHQRRHSIGLNEAMKAAAIRKEGNRMSLNTTTSPPLGSPLGLSAEESSEEFRFPNISQGPNEYGQTSPPLSGGGGQAHNRSKSMPYGPQSFKFPQESELLVPPVPNFSVNQTPAKGHSRKGSHYRTGSRNYDPNTQVNMNTNWRVQQQQHHRQNSQLEPPSTFVPGHKARNSSFTSMTGVSGGANNANTNGRKSLFAPYLPQSSLPGLIEEGKLVVGTLRVNKKNRSDAYVSTDGVLDADIFICGSKDRNRALEGDLVAVELLVVDEVWESKKEKEEKKRRKDNTLNKVSPGILLNDDIHNDATSTSTRGNSAENEDKSENESEGTLTRRGSLKQRPTMKKNDDVEVEGQSLLLVEEEEINDQVKPLYAGHIVAIIDRIPAQIFSGTLGLLRPAQAAQAAKDIKSGKEPYVQQPKAPKIVWFKPTDKKVPLIAIPTEQAPKDFVEDHEKYADQLFVSSIKRWPITSLHPFGTLIGRIGKINDPQTEIDSIMRDNNFPCDEYPEGEEEEVMLNSYINDMADPLEELSNVNRIEYVNDYIISFIHSGDFVDHALHVKRLTNTRIELGFHVADVSYFIGSGSLLDRKAKKRSSSVFLPQKATHLYPQAVNNTISFKENERNLAVSVIFEIDTFNFEIEDLYFHESIIVPKQTVHYDTFNDILNGIPVEEVSSATCDYIKTFSLIAKEFRRQRLDDKDIDITPNLNLLDLLDVDKLNLSLNIFDDNLACTIVNEISHKVNSAVAAKIHSKLGGEALLRRHAYPTLQKLESFTRKAHNLGFDIDSTNSATLQKSILKIEDPVKRHCIETLLYKCISRGRYYIAGKQDPDTYYHYYFNMPLYTHFTGPLRRYADLIVQRQLKTVLQGEYLERTGREDALKAIADYCNFKKDCAVNAQEQAIHLLLSQTINDLSKSTGHILCMGVVLQVYESSFDVFVPELGIEKRVHGDQLPLVKAEFDKFSRVLELFWEKGVDSATYVPPDEQSSLSYRSSIKNKFRTSSLEAAKIQMKSTSESESGATDSFIERLAQMNLKPPSLSKPFLVDGNKSHFMNTKSMPSSPMQPTLPMNQRTNSSSLLESEVKSKHGMNGLDPYLKNVTTRIENDNCIQEIRELDEVPILVRAEIGMALPCLTVRSLNPFFTYDG